MKHRFSLLVLTAAAWALPAWAKYDGQDRGRPMMPAQAPKVWQSECGSCHIPYAPGLLPAASWEAVMRGLDRHFGTDASLPPEQAQTIRRFLLDHASNRWTSSAAPLRITETGWFAHKHRAEEVDPAVWKRPSVKSKANCEACHADAAQGNFDEHRIRIPK